MSVYLDNRVWSQLNSDPSVVVNGGRGMEEDRGLRIIKMRAEVSKAAGSRAWISKEKMPVKQESKYASIEVWWDPGFVEIVIGHEGSKQFDSIRGSGKP